MAWSLKGRNPWFGQSPHLILGSSQTPGTNLLVHAGAYPGLPVLLLSKRVGKTSARPRKRDRKRLTFSAADVGAEDINGIEPRLPVHEEVRVEGVQESSALYSLSSKAVAPELPLLSSVRSFSK